MKVVGIGLNKTGTTTLGKALSILGFTDHHSWSEQLTFDLYNGRVDNVLDFISEYNNIEDFPWPLMYKEIEQNFPESRFILTVRKSPEIWWNSQCRHYERTPSAGILNKLIYGCADPSKCKNKYIDFYLKHNKEVKEHFKHKDNFIELSWDKGNGWRELCSFLNLDVPDGSFPFLNETPAKSFVGRVQKVFRRKYLKYIQS